ncbi:MAG TPA: hypothetical protein VLA05_06195 [Coriobacteriia bacterium]|nr:hypothetical protein [Coriobacteriia bacterium]
MFLEGLAAEQSFHIGGDLADRGVPARDTARFIPLAEILVFAINQRRWK